MHNTLLKTLIIVPTVLIARIFIENLGQPNSFGVHIGFIFLLQPLRFVKHPLSESSLSHRCHLTIEGDFHPFQCF
jgi:hypothetical protein